jgi:Protein of unknown function (DUF983)
VIAGGRPSPFAAGLRSRCPACGRGALFTGFLTVRERCPACAADLSAQDSGDGPAAFIVLIVGAIVVALALVSEVRVRAAGLAPPRALAAAHDRLERPHQRQHQGHGMIALQYKHRPDDFTRQG